MARRKKKEYCVHTVPAGQAPAKLLKCFRTKAAARKFGRRMTYTQIIPRSR